MIREDIKLIRWDKYFHREGRPEIIAFYFDINGKEYLLDVDIEIVKRFNCRRNIFDLWKCAKRLIISELHLN